VIVRPHAPDFVYSRAEIDQMLLDIDALKKSVQMALSLAR